MDMVGIDRNPKQHRDGVSLVKSFDGSVLPFDRTFYWTYPSNHSLGHKASLAMRKGPYKLIYWPNNKAAELYNIATDISESKHLSKSHPEILKAMLDTLKKWPPAKKILSSIK